MVALRESHRDNFLRGHLCGTNPQRFLNPRPWPQAISAKTLKITLTLKPFIRDGIDMDNNQPAAYLAAVADRPRKACLAQLRTGSHTG